MVGDNIEIHLVFTLCNNLFPFVFNNLTSLHYSRCLLGEEKNMCMWSVKALQAFALGVTWKDFKTKLIQCTTQWTTNMKRITFLQIYVVTPLWTPMKITSSQPKYISLLLISCTIYIFSINQKN